MLFFPDPVPVRMWDYPAPLLTFDIHPTTKHHESLPSIPERTLRGLPAVKPVQQIALLTKTFFRQIRPAFYMRSFVRMEIFSSPTPTLPRRSPRGRHHRVLLFGVSHNANLLFVVTPRGRHELLSPTPRYPRVPRYHGTKAGKHPDLSPLSLVSFRGPYMPSSL